jgi:hypothetical protein
MEDFAEALAKLPQLAPGIIIGTVIGLGWGLYQDRRKEEVGNFWQAAGLGLVLGAVGWWLLLELS